jgi:poly(3-hydroxybutyrate) depolymerase
LTPVPDEGATPAAPAALLADLAAFFRTEDRERRAALASSVAAHPAFERSRLGAWLHRLDLWETLPPGRRDLAVPVGCGEVRPVLLRVPKGYTPERPWPFLYLLHPSGSNGPSFLGYLEQLLGPRIDDFLVAAPSHYRQTGLDAPAPFTIDHLAIFQAVRRVAHVDADRTYAIGYSTGGYAAWAVALFHADQVAGAVAIGSVFTVPPGEDGLWKSVLPNFAQVPVMHVWGSRDSMPVIAMGSRDSMGTMAEVNQRFREWTKKMDLPIEDCRIPGRGHGGLKPPSGPLAELLARRRVHYPRQVDHTFRHVHQGHCYWLEAHTWEGPHWGPQLPRVDRKPGENDAHALGRTVKDLLGTLRGEISGQRLAVDRSHVGDFTVWVGEGMLDWQAPVEVEVAGRKVFEAPLQPDLLVCLEEAARTFDFDRLRWAGVRVEARGAAEPVTGRTPFPPLLPAAAATAARAPRPGPGMPRPHRPFRRSGR